MSPTAPWREFPFSFVKLTLKVQETGKKSESVSGYLKCLIIVDAQFDIKNNELESIKYWYTRMHGSKQHPVQHSHYGSNEFRQEPVPCEPTVRPLLWQVWLHHAHLPDWLTIVKTLFEGTNNPLYYQQLPPPQKTSKVAGASWSVPSTSSISVWVLTQQDHQHHKAFPGYCGSDWTFLDPLGDTTKVILKDSVGELSQDWYKVLNAKLKRLRFNHLVSSRWHPYRKKLRAISLAAGIGLITKKKWWKRTSPLTLAAKWWTTPSSTRSWQAAMCSNSKVK